MMSDELGYPHLQDADFVFEALLGYGMFSDKLPPCFTSVELFKDLKTEELTNKPINHAYIEYSATRNTNVPRQLAIPHPESYWYLCYCIKKNWQAINKHIGKPEIKFNFCHVRKMKDKKHIFEMNYNGTEKWSQEELILDYSLGCRYVVSADISTFFPSVYVHSIPWAVKGKEWAKNHRCNSWNKKKNKGQKCKTNGNQLCEHEKGELWPNDLDAISRSIKDGETNGLLIGPHTSNIISEIILTQVDQVLQNTGYKKVIRHIDDYDFFARDEKEARAFLKKLTLELKKYELTLNAKKTKITKYQDFSHSHWITQLNQFSFPDNTIGFTTINSYIEYALRLSHENNNYAILNYAIKAVANKKLSNRAKRLYIKKILQITLDHPYLLPLLEENVFIFADGNYAFMDNFLDYLLKKSLENSISDALAFVFYYAIKYKIELKSINWREVININDGINDCISAVLAHQYCKNNNLEINIFEKEAKSIKKLPERDQDKFWLFLYEVLPENEHSGLLRKLKKVNVSFIKQINVSKQNPKTRSDAENADGRMADKTGNR